MTCKRNLGPILHVRACRVMVPDLKNDWTDCAQIGTLIGTSYWGAVKDSWKHPHAVPHVEDSTSLSLACGPIKASYWSCHLFILSAHVTISGPLPVFTNVFYPYPRGRYPELRVNRYSQGYPELRVTFLLIHRGKGKIAFTMAIRCKAQVRTG